MGSSTVDHLLEEDVQRRVRRTRRRSGATFTAAVGLILGLAVADVLTPLGVYGVDGGRAEATADDGTTLAVRYPAVARPALAVPFDIVVTKPGGFAPGEQLTIEVDTAYLTSFDLNGIIPAPAEETADAVHTAWTFDTPDGEVLRIVYEARIEPGVQEDRPGRVALVDDQGAELAAVSFTTHVRP